MRMERHPVIAGTSVTVCGLSGPLSLGRPLASDSPALASLLKPASLPLIAPALVAPDSVLPEPTLPLVARALAPLDPDPWMLPDPASPPSPGSSRKPTIA